MSSRRRLSAADLEAIEATAVEARAYADRQGDADPDKFSRRYAGLMRWAIVNDRELKSIPDFYVEAHE